MTSASRHAFALRAGRWAAAALIAILYGGSGCGVHFAQSASAADQGAENGETIVLVRHGEKPANGLGQLSCMGLNRSLVLPGVLIGRFGRAAAIFAPDPADRIGEGPSGPAYSYVRPLATIEPTAIELGLSVNTQLSYQDIADLQRAVTAPAYAHSTAFIAWEHGYAYRFAQQMLRSYGQDSSLVPSWPESDYEMMYIFHITRKPAAGAGRAKLTFQVQQEGLTNSLSNTCPDEQTAAH